MTAGPDIARQEATLRRLELVVLRRLDGLLHGDHTGLVPGAGTDPGEGRLYRPGDDVRRMDWNLTARTAVPHVRETVADRELECWAVVDRTASLDFGTARCEKRDLALAAVGAVGFLTARAGNRLGAVLSGPPRVETVPARSGRDAVYGLLHRLVVRPRADASPEGGGLAGALDVAARTARRRGMMLVVSDFLEPGWERPLRALAGRHDVLCAEVRDPLEDGLPPVGFLTLVDPETGRRLEVPSGSRRLRERFAAAAAAQRSAIAAGIRRSGAAHLALSTDRDWLLDVARFVAGRRRRR